MIGILVASHGRFAEGIADAVHLIMGNQEQFDFVGLYEGADFEQFKATISTKITELNQGQGVLVFTDLFAASPYNASAAVAFGLKESMNIRIISGMNLSMLLEVLVARQANDQLDELYQIIMQTGKEGIQEFFEQVNGGAD